MQIAIDGPVAAGKSTVAKLLSQKLGLLYVDTGAMYRAVALKAKQLGIDWLDEDLIVELMSTLSLELIKPEQGEGRLVTVLLDGQDISTLIRTSEIAEGASIVSTYDGVRTALVQLQQNLAYGEAVVMEGRDIAKTVLPNADVKIYMDASGEIRAKRKWQFLKQLGMDQPISQVTQDMQKRDAREMSRDIDPLMPAVGAWILDTSSLTIDQVIEKIIKKIQSLPSYKTATSND